jgi:tRNA pseudouridine13 synthase
VLALDPPRAHGGALGRARLRCAPEDFVVDEQLGFEPDGAGAHWLLRIRKRGANTNWVARELARLAGVAARDVGYAGLKDRNAVATQWFSVPFTRHSPADWTRVAGEGFEVLSAAAHGRKLPRGALAGNRFALVAREIEGCDREDAEARLRRIALQGVPNYFGPQRFGRQLSNLRACMTLSASQGGTGARHGRVRDPFALSAARSLVFNAVLARRVADGSWNRLLPGDCANLDGRNSVFAVSAADPALEARAAAGDLHPTGPLWGDGGPRPTGAVQAMEAEVAAQFPEALALAAAACAESARRPLRVAVRDLAWRWDDASNALAVEFLLRSGGFATSVVSEIFSCDDCEEE